MIQKTIHKEFMWFNVRPTSTKVKRENLLLNKNYNEALLAIWLPILLLIFLVFLCLHRLSIYNTTFLYPESLNLLVLIYFSKLVGFYSKFTFIFFSKSVAKAYRIFFFFFNRFTLHMFHASFLNIISLFILPTCMLHSS